MLLVEKVNSYSSFTEAATEILESKFLERTIEEGYVSEMKNLKDIQESFKKINEACSKDKGVKEEDEEDSEEDEDSDDEDDSEDEED